MRTRSLLQTGLLLLILYGLWEGAIFFFHLDKWLLPRPIHVVQAFLALIPTIQKDVFATSQIALTGLVIGTILGVIVASFLHLFPALRKGIYPVIVFSQNVPMIVLAPLFVVWFGFGDTAKWVVVALVCFFPVTVATLDGFKQTNPALRTYMQMEGASHWEIFRILEFRAALPSFFSGLKLSASYSVMSAVIAEWLGAPQGLGVMMVVSSHSFRMDQVFVGLFLVAFLSILLFYLITWIEKITIFWERGETW